MDIELVDANDNAPVFANTLYEATIIENATMGTIVTMVSAEDMDSNQNAVVFYGFQSPISEWVCVWVWVGGIGLCSDVCLHTVLINKFFGFLYIRSLIVT